MTFDDFADIDEGLLLKAAKRSLQKYTPTFLKCITIRDEKLISKVWERNRRGEKKIIKKIVCPFCFTAISPQYRPGSKRLDITNFNRHLSRSHSEQHDTI